MARARNPQSGFGRGSDFPVTWWTGIRNAQWQELVRAELYKQYWDPLYCYARRWLQRKGLAAEDAQDFTEGFLIKALLEHKFLAQADRRRGRFRSYLTTSFENYMYNQLRKKKVPTGAESDVSEYQIPEAVPHDPGAAFDYALACQRLDGALADLETECTRDGLQVHWRVFQERKVKPLTGGRPAGMKEICRAYGIASESQASNMIITVERRFCRLLGRRLTHRGASPEEVKEALADFLSIFAQFRRA